MKEKILEEAKTLFKPEFLNRLDDLVVFHMLEKADLNQIVDLEVAKLVNEKQIALTLDPEPATSHRERLRSRLRRPADAPRRRALPRRPARRGRLLRGLPLVGGKRLKARARFLVGHEPGSARLVLDDLTIWGISLPNDWLGGLKGHNLLEEALGAQSGGIAGVEEFRVESGRLIIRLAE
jgi:hypothetical protein